jgi:hypothetical protein
MEAWLESGKINRTDSRNIVYKAEGLRAENPIRRGICEIVSGSVCGQERGRSRFPILYGQRGMIVIDHGADAC